MPILSHFLVHLLADCSTSAVCFSPFGVFLEPWLPCVPSWPLETAPMCASVKCVNVCFCMSKSSFSFRLYSCCCCRPEPVQVNRSFEAGKLKLDFSVGSFRQPKLVCVCLRPSVPQSPLLLIQVHERSTHGGSSSSSSLLLSPSAPAQMEEVIARMQHEQNGIPIRTVKSFLTKIPSVFSGKPLLSDCFFFLIIFFLSVSETEKTKHLGFISCFWLTF